MIPFHLRHTVTFAQVAAELARELEQRTRFYPRRVEEGRMAQAEADHQLAIAAAWQQDVARLADMMARTAAEWEAFCLHGRWPEGAGLRPATHGLAWQARREALQRELDLRARIFPRRVQDGAMTKVEADHRLACLEALADRYDDGLDWTGPDGAPGAIGNPHWEAHLLAVLERRGADPDMQAWLRTRVPSPARQEEMAL